MSQRRQSFHLAHPAPPSPARAGFEIHSGMFGTVSEDTIHAIFAPLHYEHGYSYPLLVWLHGSGNDERQLLRIMPLVSMRNYVAVAPRGLLVRDSLPPHAETCGWSQEDQYFEQAEHRIFDCLDLVDRSYHIAPRRIFLAGFDTGGTMAFRVAMNHPQRFAGVLSIGGAFPTGRGTLAHLPEARQLPVFLATGRRSALYSEDDVCPDLRLLHSAGVNTTVRIYPSGHELSPQILGDVDRWIMAQINGPAPAATSARE